MIVAEIQLMVERNNHCNQLAKKNIKHVIGMRTRTTPTCVKPLHKFRSDVYSNCNRDGVVKLQHTNFEHEVKGPQEITEMRRACCVYVNASLCGPPIDNQAIFIFFKHTSQLGRRMGLGSICLRHAYIWVVQSVPKYREWWDKP